MPAATAGTVELYQGSDVTQYFMTGVQRLDSVSVLWGTYYRANAGTVTVELLRTDTGEVLMSGQFAAVDIPEGGTTTIYAQQPIEGLPGVELALHITADSAPGEAVSPADGCSKSFNRRSLAERRANDRSLVFQHGGYRLYPRGTALLAAGEYCWRGIAGSAGICMESLPARQTGYSGRSNTRAVKKYRFLIKQLVSRDFKTKYKRSVLGVFWSFLNPLFLTMTVQYFIFFDHLQVGH